MGGTIHVKSCLRVYGPEIESTTVTSLIGLPPTYAHDLGDLVSPRSTRRRSESMWMLDSPLGDAATVAEHLEWFMRVLPPELDIWSRLTAITQIDLVTTLSLSGDTATIVVPPGAARYFGERGIEVQLDLWNDSPASPSADDSPRSDADEGSESRGTSD